MKKYKLFSLFFVVFLSLPAILSAAGTAGFRGGAVNPETLPEDLKSIKIENQFIDSGGWPVGTVQQLTGDVVVLRNDTKRAFFAALGDNVYQNDMFFTLQDSRCRIRFSTDDIVTMGENGKISIDEVNEDHLQKKKKSVINMLRGKAMFYVTRLFKYKNVSATVKTPTAVMGVRGTKFGVEVRKVGEKVADLSDKSFIYLAQNEGSNFETVVYGFEGSVNVTSIADGSTQTVGEGQNLVLDNTGAGNIVQTDPNTANQFIGATEGGSGSGGSGGTGSGGGDGSGGTGAEGGSEEGESDTGDIGDTIETGTETISQTLTAQTIESSVVSGGKVGYFAALLTRFDGTNTFLADVYKNSSRSDFITGSVSGNSIVDPLGSITATGTEATEDTPYVTRVKTEAGGPYDSGDLGTSRQMNNSENTAGWPMNDNLGENSYMKWGFWAMSRWVPLIPPSYAVTDRAYYVEGLSTPDDAVAGMTGLYNYAGSAWGTYFDGAGGVDMVGTFSCGVDMTARTVMGFNMSVAGGSLSASITGGSGGFVGSSGEFNITGGNWYLNDPSPIPVVIGGTVQPGASASCTGSLFGPNAEHMGGSWGMDAGFSNNAAVGVFVGDKSGTPTTPPMPPAIP